MPKSLKSIMVLDRVIIFHSFEAEKNLYFSAPGQDHVAMCSWKMTADAQAIILVTSFGKIHTTISCCTGPGA